MNAQAIPLTAGHGSMGNYANSEGARQLVAQNLQKRASMRNTGTKQPAAQAPAAKSAARASASGLKPIELKKNDTGVVACLMSFLGAFLEVIGVAQA